MLQHTPRVVTNHFFPLQGLWHAAGNGGTCAQASGHGTRLWHVKRGPNLLPINVFHHSSGSRAHKPFCHAHNLLMQRAQALYMTLQCVDNRLEPLEVGLRSETGWKRKLFVKETSDNSGVQFPRFLGSFHFCAETGCKAVFGHQCLQWVWTREPRQPTNTVLDLMVALTL